MNNKLNLFNIGLPTNEDLNTWSKDCIKQRLDHNISGNLIPFVSEAPDYELNENMVALYDFHANPIKGKYQQFYKRNYKKNWAFTTVIQFL